MHTLIAMGRDADRLPRINRGSSSGSPSLGRRFNWLLHEYFIYLLIDWLTIF